jgi:hypothetical protein
VRLRHIIAAFTTRRSGPSPDPQFLPVTSGTTTDETVAGIRARIAGATDLPEALGSVRTSGPGCAPRPGDVPGPERRHTARTGGAGRPGI